MGRGRRREIYDMQLTRAVLFIFLAGVICIQDLIGMEDSSAPPDSLFDKDAFIFLGAKDPVPSSQWEEWATYVKKNPSKYGGIVSAFLNSHEINHLEMEFLSSFPNLSELYIGSGIEGVTISPGVMSIVVRFPSLHKLNVSIHGLTDEHFLAIRSLVNLESLLIEFPSSQMLTTEAEVREWHPIKLTNLCLHGISELSKLKELRIAKHKLHPGDTFSISDEAIAKLLNMPKLQKLSISHDEFSDGMIAGVASNTSIDELEIRSNILTNESLGHISVDPLSRKWMVFSDRFTDDGLRLIGSSATLESFVIGGIDNEELFSDAGLEFLADSVSILSLGISSNRFSDAGLRAMRSLAVLQNLSIRSNRFTDEGITVLAESESLEELFIQSNSLTRDCVKRVVDINSLKRARIRYDQGFVEVNIQSLESGGTQIQD